MALETGSFIDDLVITNPPGTDGKNEGDDHLRLVKKVVKATFPGLIGAAWRVQAKSSAYTVVAGDNMTAFNCTAALTLSLTAAATLGNQHMFVVIANGGDVTIDPGGAETINGAATLVVPDGAWAVVVGNGTLFLALVAPVSLTAFALTLLDDADAGTVRTTIDAQVDLDVPSQAEAEAGTSTSERVWTAQRVKQAIDALAGQFPAGTSMLFQQTSAPTGWTKQTTHNNKAVRLQTGTVTTGGGDSFSTVFGTGKATASHTLTTSEMPSHTHGLQQGDSAGTGSQTTATKATGLTSAAAGGGGGHTHNLTSLDLQFVDFIIANKD